LEANVTIEVLKGIDSPASALITFDYPFGRRVRCIRRTWVETKGGRQRLVHETSHKSFNIEYTRHLEQDGREAADQWATEQLNAGRVIWNATKCSTYFDLLVPFMRHMPGETMCPIETAVLQIWSWPEHFAEFYQTVGDDLSDEQRAMAQSLETASRKLSAQSWSEWDAKQAAVVAA
jgi:hypothetical protein